MTEFFRRASHAPRRRPLAAAAASIFALCAPAAFADTWQVLNCDGDAVTGDIGLKTGALRFAIANAASGDTVDLGSLNCVDSKVSLVTGGSITVPQPSLTIKGPPGSTVTIDASALSNDAIAYSNIFVHTGGGTLTIQDLTLTGGHVNHRYASSLGGCIYSKANVVLEHVGITACSAHSLYDTARGGGVYALGNMAVYDSLVSGNSATAGTQGSGGGLYAKGNLKLEFSTLSGNHVDGSSQSFGGGAHTRGEFLATYSTISGNKLYGIGYGGGLDLGGATNTISSSTISGNTSYGASGGIEVSAAGTTFLISNSTISGNHAEAFAGGLRVDASSAKFYNSTIAFNTAKFGGPTEAAGLQLQEDINVMSVVLESNVISNNLAGPTESDLGEYVPPGFAIEINGGLAAVPAHNLIRAAAVVGLPADTLTACPLLGTLRDNGGLTQTHALLSHSPAIDAGNDYYLASYDQRSGALINGTIDYLRVSGPNGDPSPQADIGAYEVQQDDIVFNADFEGCP